MEIEFSQNKQQLKEAELRGFIFALLHSTAGVWEPSPQGFLSSQGKWEPKWTSFLPRRVRNPVGLRPLKTGFLCLKEVERASVLSHSARSTGLWLSGCCAQFVPHVDLFRVAYWPQAVRPELPAAPQPLQVLHISEQEEDIFAFRMSLKQPVIRHTEDRVHTELLSSSGRRSHDLCGASVQLINTEVGPFILPRVFWAEIWLSPLHLILFLVICNQSVDFFLGEPPQQEPAGLWSGGVSSLIQAQSLLSKQNSTMCWKGGEEGIGLSICVWRVFAVVDLCMRQCEEKCVYTDSHE